MKFERVSFSCFRHNGVFLRRGLGCFSYSTVGLLLAITSVSFFPSVVVADETSLYVSEMSSRRGVRPQVLIIFDNSGSMNAIVKDVPAPFRDKTGGINQGERIYFSLDAADALPNPNDISQKQYFTFKNNACSQSVDLLSKYGMFTGFIRHYSFNGKSGTWVDLSNETNQSINLVDCFEDIQGNSYSNLTAFQAGLPVDGLPAANGIGVPYTLVNASSSAQEQNKAKEKALNTQFGTGGAVTLYTQEYLEWYYGKKNLTDRTRLNIGKEALTKVLLTTPGVDFGLALFNRNGPTGTYDGARIVRRIFNDSPDETELLINKIRNLDADTSTPLCESLYEAYRYFAGEAVYFGKEDKGSTPKADEKAEDNGKYISPFKTCLNRAYVVLVTDGNPANDDAADELIKRLNGGQDSYTFGFGANRKTSYLPSLASWMNSNDIHRNRSGSQSVSTYTIGFSDGAVGAKGLLETTAQKGGGIYFDASDTGLLQQRFLQAVTNILDKSASFTAPSVASNNFNRIQTFESVYYAMFLPNRGPRWGGNLKKFKVTESGDVIDANGKPVLDSDGNISKTACSHWSSKSVCDEGDGSDVRVGGAASKLQQMVNRRVLSNLGGNGAQLKDLTLTSANSIAGGSANLAALLGVDNNSTQIENVLKWARGVDVDDDDRDNNKAEVRQDVMGDPLHSNPLAINFGTGKNPDIRVLVGTNHGIMHMFKDEGNSLSEVWAFLPWELLPNIQSLRENTPSGVHSVYGIDGSPVVWSKKNAAGNLEEVWLFFGLRRGGSAYYAMEIFKSDKPVLKWRIDSSSPGMALMGQSWSKPVVTFIPGYETTPVLIFGAGYMPANKDVTTLGTSDSLGRGVFVVNADTGELIHSFGPQKGEKMTLMPEIRDSIPNEVGILDSNNDGLTDRIYATDTGGNVWRMDIPSESPFDKQKPWSAFKFARLGGNSLESDRRFFAAPVVAQTAMNNMVEYQTTENNSTNTVTSTQLIPYDAVVVGSGLRPAPKDVQRDDMFFSLQDRHIGIHSFNGATADSIPPPPLVIADLYDVTQAPPLSKQENIKFSLKRGWYYRFSRSGEKSVSSATIVNGRVFFTSYVPGETDMNSNQCLVPGKGFLYGFDLHRGIRSYQSTYIEMSDSLPDTPQLVVPSTQAMYLIGIGKAADLMVKKPCDKNNEHCDGCPPGDEKCIGGGMRTDKVYYYAN